MASDRERCKALASPLPHRTAPRPSTHSNLLFSSPAKQQADAAGCSDAPGPSGARCALFGGGQVPGAFGTPGKVRGTPRRGGTLGGGTGGVPPSPAAGFRAHKLAYDVSDVLLGIWPTPTPKKKKQPDQQPPQQQLQQPEQQQQQALDIDQQLQGSPLVLQQPAAQQQADSHPAATSCVSPTADEDTPTGRNAAATVAATAAVAVGHGDAVVAAGDTEVVPGRLGGGPASGIGARGGAARRSLAAAWASSSPTSPVGPAAQPPPAPAAAAGAPAATAAAADAADANALTAGTVAAATAVAGGVRAPTQLAAHCGTQMDSPASNGSPILQPPCATPRAARSRAAAAAVVRAAAARRAVGAARSQSRGEAAAAGEPDLGSPTKAAVPAAAAPAGNASKRARGGAAAEAANGRPAPKPRAHRAVPKVGGVKVQQGTADMEEEEVGVQVVAGPSERRSQPARIVRAAAARKVQFEEKDEGEDEEEYEGMSDGESSYLEESEGGSENESEDEGAVGSRGAGGRQQSKSGRKAPKTAAAAGAVAGAVAVAVAGGDGAAEMEVEEAAGEVVVGDGVQAAAGQKRARRAPGAAPARTRTKRARTSAATAAGAGEALGAGTDGGDAAATGATAATAADGAPPKPKRARAAAGARAKPKPAPFTVTATTGANGRAAKRTARPPKSAGNFIKYNKGNKAKHSFGYESRSAASGRLKASRTRLRRINGKIVRAQFRAPRMAGQGADVADGFARDSRCFRCGGTGHWAAHCPYENGTAPELLQVRATASLCVHVLLPVRACVCVLLPTAANVRGVLSTAN